MKVNSILFIFGLLFSQLVFAQGEPLRKVRFIPQWSPQSQFAGYYMAEEKGIYKKYGLDVTIIDGGFNKNVITHLKEGKADIGTLILSSGINERTKGTKLVNIGQIINKSTIVFVAKKKSGIQTLNDFNGKKIAAWRTILQTETAGFLKKHQIEAEIIPVNEGVNLFLKDAVEICAVMYYNEFNDLYNYGINPDELVTFFLKDYGMNMPEDGVYCKEEFFEKNPGLCKDFMEATFEGWDYAFEHRQEALDLIKQKQRALGVMTSTANSKWMLDCMKTYIYPNDTQRISGVLQESDFNFVQKVLMELKLYEKGVEYQDFYRKTE
jgi:NitT/TauT family transport system substrate-binding protein